MSKLTPAQKAGRTRAARKAFESKYGHSQYVVVRDLMRNDDTNTVALRFGLWTSSVAATLANLNRWGTFHSMAYACNW